MLDRASQTLPGMQTAMESCKNAEADSVGLEASASSSQLMLMLPVEGAHHITDVKTLEQCHPMEIRQEPHMIATFTRLIFFSWPY